MIAIRDTTSGTDLTDVVEGLRYSNVNPGGFESCSFTVPADRCPSGGAWLVISDSHGVLWEGRVEENDLSVGDGDRRGVTAYGFGMALKKTYFREVFVDIDMGAWVGPSVAFQIALGGSYSPEGGSVSPDDTTGASALGLVARGDWAAAGKPHPMAQYVSTVDIASIYYAWKIGPTVSSADANWAWDVLIEDSDVWTGTQASSGSLRAAGPSTGTLTNAVAGRTYGRVALYYGVAGGVAGVDYPIYWTCLAVYGNHGLTKRGSEDAIAAKGFYGGDILQNLLARASGIGVGTIDAPTYVVRDFKFLERTDIESAVVELNKYFGYDWGTWDSGNLFDSDPKFSWTAKPSTAKWTVRRADCDRIELASSLSQMADTVYVKYRTVIGQEKELTATSPVRALNDAGMTGQATIIGDGSMVTQDNAQQQADIFFALQGQDPPMSGAIDLSGDVQLAAGGSRPAYHLRADGALLRIEDLLPVTEVYDLSDLRQTLLPIKRVEVDASGETIRTSVQIDQASDAMSTLQAHLVAPFVNTPG